MRAAATACPSMLSMTSGHGTAAAAAGCQAPGRLLGQHGLAAVQTGTVNCHPSRGVAHTPPLALLH